MTKDEVKVGATYTMNHTSGTITVTILRVKPTLMRGHWSGSKRTMTHWIARNIGTGREITIKSALRLVREVVE